VRGALAALTALDSGAEVVAASAGNHGLGVAWAATVLGRRATVVVPANASPAKVAALEGFDVRVVRHGSSYDDAELRGLELAAEGGVFVSPYNDPRVIAGQATIGRELDVQLPDAPVTVVCPIGGGGLSSGLGLWASTRAGARVVAVEAEPSQPFGAALAAGRLVPITAGPTLADGLGGNVEPGAVTFELVRAHVDSVLAAAERDIEDAVRFMATACGLVVEGAAAAAVAAVRAGSVPGGSPVVIVVSGRNIARARLAALLAAA
jgi:threonine dehydratase